MGRDKSKWNDMEGTRRRKKGMSKKREMERTIEKVLWAQRGLGLAREKISIV